METFVVTFTAKPGTEQQVADFYINQQAEYEAAPGFIGRRLLQARTGTMVAAVKARLSEEEMAKHPEPHHHDEPTTHFVIIEEWESVDARMDFSMSRDRSREKGLFPLLEPQHSHEFYDDITP